MKVRTRKGAPISVNTMHFILENPFYYGEMKTKRGLMPHIYKPLVNKELWDMCQAQKAIRAGQFLRTSDKNLLYRGLIICGVTNRQCPCELKKDVFSYIFEKSSNVDLKRLLLKFVFENITLTEGQISYKLRFPFNEFANLTTPKKNKPTSYEPTPNLINLSVRANNNQNVQSGYMQFCEPKIMLKKQEVALKNATSLQSGWGGWIRTNE